MIPTLYEQVGGEGKVRDVIDKFVDRVMADAMIGFFFRKTRPERLKELEYQHAAAFLGADIKYTGRPLDGAHRGFQIQGGQFLRRRQILKEVLEECGVDTAICQAWLAHQDTLKPLILGDDRCL